MTLDLYSYGRAQHPSSTASGPSAHRPIFICAGCGCSVVATEPRLIRSLGWRILETETDAPERRALCPGCGRRSIGRMV